MDPLTDLADQWRQDADTLRSYGAERLATACEKHADELEQAAVGREDEPVTLEKAAEIGGYSYSHLQHLVAEGTIENVGQDGAPRIRRGDVPRKPGHGTGGEPTSKGEVLDADVLQLRQGQGADR